MTGFTLMELMIVIIVVGLLISIALPAYQNAMFKGRRADAKEGLMTAANRQERLMLDRSTYTATMTDLGYANDPLISTEGFYTIDAAACGGGTIATCYVLTATPAVGSPQLQDAECISFSLDWTGAKTATSANCW
ncbi:MAG: type IV pilin protein [Halioglobus sp.]